MRISNLIACGCAYVASCSDSAVFVSQYLPDRFEEGQRATKNDLSSLGWKGGNAMHSGFITIDPNLGTNSFFWYSEALDGNASAPVILWLQGGPGASSLFGMFTEIGPFGIDASGSVVEREISWNAHHHMLFIDNPVGTGYSFTESDEGFVRDQKHVGWDLYVVLRQFFQLFPNLHKNDFYVTGESYAGKYVPACAWTIHVWNKEKEPKDRINLKGITIVDGVIDPGSQFQGFGDMLFNMAMIGESERQQFKKYEDMIVQHLKDGDALGAFHVFDEMLNGDEFPYPTYYANVTGMGTNYFNIALSPDATPLGGGFVDWLNKPEVRAETHVGDRKYAPLNETVEKYLLGDWMVGVTDMLVPLLNNYKVLICSGQNDVILGAPLTERFLNTFNWTVKNGYPSAKKVVWRRKAKGPGSQMPDVAGYARQVGSFVRVVVRGAGHMVPGDQPARALDMIERFIQGKSFGDVEETITGTSFVV